jgi:NADPH2:quinone reductase
MCLPLPQRIDDVTAAGIANPAMSSWAALTSRAKFVSGESVLILGATGVAGQLAIQIAKHLGARRVIAAGRNPQTLEKLKALGADAAISLDQDREPLVSAFRSELAESGLDVVLDYLWGQPAERVLETISQKGLRKAAVRLRFIQIGESAGKTISLPAATLRSYRKQGWLVYRYTCCPCHSRTNPRRVESDSFGRSSTEQVSGKDSV